MSQQTIPSNESPEILIERVQGNLQVKGWDQPGVNIKGSPNQFTIEQQDDAIRVNSQGNCMLRIPYGSNLQIERVDGIAQIKRLEDQLQINQVQGPLQLRNVGDTHIEEVQGDLHAKHIGGSLTIERVQGNANIRNVQGDCQLETIEGNLNLRDVEGDLSATVKGNAYIRLSELAGDQYEIQAAGNAQIRIPEGTGITLKVSSGAPNITVKTSQGTKTYPGKENEIVLGTGEVEMGIQAGGWIMVSTDEPAWKEGEEGEADSDDDFGGFPDNFSSQISRQVEAQIEAQMQAITRQFNEQMSNLNGMFGKSGLSPETTEELIKRARENSERATAQAEERMRRSQERLERKLEAARRRGEIKAQAAERRAQGRRRSWSFDMNPPAPGAPEKEPASEEERLMILRMLEQKKITIEEAEKLLAALEGEGD